MPPQMRFPSRFGLEEPCDRADLHLVILRSAQNPSLGLPWFPCPRGKPRGSPRPFQSSLTMQFTGHRSCLRTGRSLSPPLAPNPLWSVT